MKLIQNAIVGIIIAYLFSAMMIFTPYFNWMYAKENGFIKWIVFGEVVATAKGFVWPYILLSKKSDPSAGHFVKALRHINKANRISNEAGKNPSKQDIENILTESNEALDEAKKTDIISMNNHIDGFGTHFRDEFIAGLDKFIVGINTSNNEESLEGQSLLEKWGVWFDENREKIVKLK